MNHRSDELNLLLHSLREFLCALVLPILQFQFAKPFIDALVRLFAADGLQLGKEAQLLADFHFLVQAALFLQVTDAVL